MSVGNALWYERCLSAISVFCNKLPEALISQDGVLPPPPCNSPESEEKAGLLLYEFKLQEQKHLTLLPFYNSFFEYCFPSPHYTNIMFGEWLLLLTSNCYMTFPFDFLFFKNKSIAKSFSFNFTDNLYCNVALFLSCIYKHTSKMLRGFLWNILGSDAEGT